MKKLIKEIEVKKFNTTRKGYNTDQVDDFLDYIADFLDTTFVDYEKMKAQLDILVDRESSIKSMEDILKQTLVTAQSTAKGLIDKAAKDSDEYYNNSKLRADTIVEDANRRAADVLAESKIKGERIISSSRQEVRDARIEHERLIRDINETIADYKGILLAQLEAIDQNTTQGSAPNSRVSMVRPFDIQFSPSAPGSQNGSLPEGYDVGDETRTFSDDERKAIIDSMKDDVDKATDDIASSIYEGFDISAGFEMAQKELLEQGDSESDPESLSIGMDMDFEEDN